MLKKKRYKRNTLGNLKRFFKKTNYIGTVDTYIKEINFICSTAKSPHLSHLVNYK